MNIERGILVDAKGNFLGAFQWDGDKPRPQFNLPSSGTNRLAMNDRKTLLAETVAEAGMEFKRWDFKAEVWSEPDTESWFVDEKGGLRGSRKHFQDQIPNVQVGWTLVNSAPLVRQGQQTYFDLTAGVWKFPLRLARVEGDVLVNFECVRDDFVSPPGVEHIPLPSLPDGRATPLGAVRDEAGAWSVPVPVEEVP